MVFKNAEAIRDFLRWPQGASFQVQPASIDAGHNRVLKQKHWLALALF
jgi:hypothetical protein